MENTKLELMTDKSIAQAIAKALANIKPYQQRVEIKFENIRTKKHGFFSKQYVTLKDPYKSVYYTSLNLESIDIIFVNCELHDIIIDTIPFSRIYRKVTYMFKNCDIDYVNLTSYDVNKYTYNFCDCKTVRNMRIGTTNKQISTEMYASITDPVDYGFERCNFDNVQFISNKGYKFTACRFDDAQITTVFMDKSTFIDCTFANCTGYYQACPESGSYVGYKRALARSKNGKTTYYVIVKLEIPADAQRSSALSRKCRASKAKVLEIKSVDGKKRFTTAFSNHDNGFKYKVGEIVEPTEPFDTNRWHECTSGIHHFITREEAINY